MQYFCRIVEKVKLQKWLTPDILADLFRYSYEADFIHGFLTENEMKVVRSFNFKFRYIDDVLN